jgi:hypothetical protein
MKLLTCRRSTHFTSRLHQSSLHVRASDMCKCIPSVRFFTLIQLIYNNSPLKQEKKFSFFFLFFFGDFKKTSFVTNKQGQHFSENVRIIINTYSLILFLIYFRQIVR